VKFAPEGLPTLKSRIRPSDLPEAASKTMGNQAPLRQLLAFNEGRKVFSTFTPADTLARHRHTGEPVRLLDLSRWYTLTVPDTSRIDALVERLKKHPLVEAAAPEFPIQPSVSVPNDTRFVNGEQWNLDNPVSDADIDAPEAWDLNKGRSDVTIAVLDGGVDYNHPDLDPGDRSRIIQGYDVADNDGNPMDDIASGKGFAGHGTLVAGVAGAITDNNQGIAGVMWNTQIMPVKVAFTNGPWWDPFGWTEGSSFRTQSAEGVDYARTNGADIINMSFGSPDRPGTIERFFIGNPLGEAAYNAYRQGLVVVSASGNNSQDQVGFPAISAGVISVGNTTIFDNLNSGSNYGPNLDLVAPGTNYPSTERGGSVTNVTGTSYSAPMVSGVAGLILSESRDRGLGLTNDDVEHLMEQTAEDLGPSGKDDQYGHGRINAFKALQALQPPNEVEQAVHTGGSGTKVYDDDQVIFYDNGLPTGVASGTYFTDIYEVTGRVTFDHYYAEPPLVWIRERSTKGWDVANPQSEMPDVTISNVTNTGFDFKTFVYDIESNINGQRIGWAPATPSGVKIAYTAIGERDTPPLSASISGPSLIDSGTSGTWSASYSGGTGSVSYSWEYQNPGSSTWSSASCTGSSCTLTFYNDGESQQQAAVRATVSRGTQSAAASKSVSVPPSCAPGAVFCLASKAVVASPEVDVEGKQVRLHWSSPKRLRTDVAIEHRTGTTDAWDVLDEISAERLLQAEKDGTFSYSFQTSDLDLGMHEFRLRLPSSVDGGAPIHSKSVSAEILLEDAYELTAYPNPVRQSATIELAVQKQQDVSVRVYDVLGRQVTTLHTGPLRAQQTERFMLNPARSQMASGTYFIRVTGEEFVATERLTVVR